MRVLIVTQIFPNAKQPTSSPFNRQQFAALARRCEVEVLATIPWFPGSRAFRRWSATGDLLDVPRQERIDGLTVEHPRSLYVPKLSAASGALYAASLLPTVLSRRGRFDVVLAAWAYPDGVASIAMARIMGLPVVVKVHGSDIDVLPEVWGVGAHMRLMLPRADAVVAVSRSLADGVARLGVPRERIHLVLNGVNRELFRIRDRGEARRAIGHGGDARPWLVYVGLVIAHKGVLDLMAAFRALAERDPDVALAIVGDGPDLRACQEAARDLKTADGRPRVVFAGAQPLAQVPLWMGAAQAVVLPSHHEGTPNVLIEALTCGRRVVATRVGGVPDVVTAPELGELVEPRDLGSLTEALGRAARQPYSPEEVAARGGRGSWDESAAALQAVLAGAMARRSSR